jgi:hypothetical protein
MLVMDCASINRDGGDQHKLMFGAVNLAEDAIRGIAVGCSCLRDDVCATKETK